MKRRSATPLRLLSADLLEFANTPISRRVKQLIQNERNTHPHQTIPLEGNTLPLCLKSITYEQYAERAQTLSERAVTLHEKESTFPLPVVLSGTELRSLDLVNHTFSLRNVKKLRKNTSMLEHMALIAFEAKPRPLSFAISRYNVVDFIAYIYQDVAQHFIDSEVVQSEEFTLEKSMAIKNWLLAPVPRKQNTPQRHIRRRLMVAFNRTGHQITSLLNGRGVAPELRLLIHKLLERDDDVGYTRGAIRDFESVRYDLNVLTRHVALGYYLEQEDTNAINAYFRIPCPSEVPDFNFSVLSIDKPRARRK